MLPTRVEGAATVVRPVTPPPAATTPESSTASQLTTVTNRAAAAVRQQPDEQSSVQRRTKLPLTAAGNRKGMVGAQAPKSQAAPLSTGRLLAVKTLVDHVLKLDAQLAKDPASPANVDHAKRVCMMLRPLTEMAQSHAPASWQPAFCQALQNTSDADLNTLATGKLFNDRKPLAQHLVTALGQGKALPHEQIAYLEQGGTGRAVLTDLKAAITHVLLERRQSQDLALAQAPLEDAITSLQEATDRRGVFTGLVALASAGDMLINEKRHLTPDPALLSEARKVAERAIAAHVGQHPTSAQLSQLADGELGALNTFYHRAPGQLQTGPAPSAALKAVFEQRLAPAKQQLAHSVSVAFTDLATNAAATDSVRDLQRASEAMENVLLKMNLLGMDTAADDKAALLTATLARLGHQFQGGLPGAEDALPVLQRIDALVDLFRDLIQQASTKVEDEAAISVLALPSLALDILRESKGLIPDANSYPLTSRTLAPAEREDYAVALGRQFGLELDWTDDGAGGIRPWLDEGRWNTLQAEYKNAIDTGASLPWTTTDIAGQPVTVQLNPTFIKDALDRPSVSISVDGVSDSGQTIHHKATRYNSFQSEDERAAHIAEDIRQLHALVGGPGLTYLTQIMNQQLAAPLLKNIAEYKSIHDADGRQVIMGGAGNFQFDVSRTLGPGSEFVIRATIRIPRVESALVADGFNAEPLALNAPHSYLRATLTLLVSADAKQVDLHSARYQYNFEGTASSP